MSENPWKTMTAELSRGHVKRAFRAIKKNGGPSPRPHAQAAGTPVLGDDGEPIVPAFWSPYLSWLTYAIPGWKTNGNIASINYAMAHLPGDEPIVEIGSFCGLSCNIITYLKGRHGRSNRLITCDRWRFEGYHEGKALGDSPHITHDGYREFVRGTFIRNAQFFSAQDLPYTVELLSDELFEAWDGEETCTDVFDRDIRLGGPISFCYIDGNHSYRFARNDFEHTDAHLVSGGFILFDDSADGSEWEVCRVVEEVIQSGRYELLARNPNYFFRKK